MDLFCICGDEDEADDGSGFDGLRSSLPPTLSQAVISAMQYPRETLRLSDSKEETTPWGLRDSTRALCVELLAGDELLFERKISRVVKGDVPPLTKSWSGPASYAAVSFAAVGVAFSLLEAESRGKAQEVVRALPRLLSDGYFQGRPRDVLPLLRPLTSAGFTTTRACALMRCRCVGARRVVSSRDEEAPPREEDEVIVELEVEYCMRRHCVSVTLKEVAAALETINPREKVDCSLEAATAAQVGRLVARKLTRLHRKIADRFGCFSPTLLRLLKVDARRVWREESPRLAALLDSPKHPSSKDDVLYLVDVLWLNKWREWAFQPTPLVPPPPQIDNSRLLRESLELGRDYRAVSSSLWAFLRLCHGGGPSLPRAREAPRIEDARVLPSRPLAIATIQRHFRVKAAAAAAARRLRPNNTSKAANKKKDAFAAAFGGGSTGHHRQSEPWRACLPASSQQPDVDANDANDFELVPLVVAYHDATTSSPLHPPHDSDQQ